MKEMNLIIVMEPDYLVATCDGCYNGKTDFESLLDAKCDVILMSDIIYNCDHTYSICSL